MGPKGILFDLDDTLVDRQASLRIFADELAEVYAEDLGEMGEEDLVRFIREADEGGYRPKAMFFKRLVEGLPWTRRPTQADIGDFWFTTFPKCTQPAAGLYDMLAALKEKGVPMGIVTNGSEASQDGKVDRLDLRVYMETVLVSEKAGIKKPDAGIFELALAHLGLPAAGVWFVGDHPENDMAGSAAVGLTPVWARGRHPWPEDLDPPGLQIDGLMDLLPLMEGDR